MTASPSPAIDWTRAASWYDDNADAFEMATLSLQPPEFLIHFANELPAGARVLDAGCGAGRDTRWLVDRGFQVDAFDLSREMVAATRANTGHRVTPRQLDFRDFQDPAGSWQGIWALASLLHLPRHEVAPTLSRLIASLTDDGILAFALKRGHGEEVDDRGRPITYFEVDEISNMVFSAMPGGGRIETDLSACPDSSGQETQWINVMAARTRPF